MSVVDDNAAVGTKAQQAQQMRRRLIAAAGELFAQRGYAETSVAAIGEAAGASRGIVNFHFGSKENLLAAVVKDIVREWEEETFDATVAGAMGGLEGVRLAVDATRRFMIERPERARLLFRLSFEALDERREFTGMFSRFHVVWRERTREWWRQGIAAGLIDAEVDHGAAVSFLLGAVRGIALDWLIAPDVIDLDATYEQLWRSFVRGIAPSGQGSAQPLIRKA